MSQPKDAAIGRMNQALRHIERLYQLLGAAESQAERDFVEARIAGLLPKAKAGPAT